MHTICCSFFSACSTTGSDLDNNINIQLEDFKKIFLDTVNKAYLIDELMDFLAKINKIFAGIVYLFQKNLIICSKKDFIHQLNKLC
ncbi:hypothetical protein [Candidatus Tisiphia endosymbiont of Oplodontha viridula]|uniref:hypothetical protein n=1 Tax=Candidatus Tisiphia endosymbiont of Oplodontha viridula TaxID=3077925 RepID=UPI0035C92645